MKKIRLRMQKDKIDHAVYSAYGSTLIGMIANAVLHSPAVSALIGFALMFTIGLLKEFVYDRHLNKGQFELYDIVANLVGCVVGLASVIAFNLDTI